MGFPAMKKGLGQVTPKAPSGCDNTSCAWVSSEDMESHTRPGVTQMVRRCGLGARKGPWSVPIVLSNITAESAFAAG